MTQYHGTRLELDPTPNNPLVVLTTKIETLVENEAYEDIDLAMSALVSALYAAGERQVRLQYTWGGDAAWWCVFKNILRNCEN